MQTCLVEGLARRRFSPEEICRCFDKSIHKAEVTTLAVDNGEVVKADESLRFTVEEVVACAYLLVHTNCVISYNEFERLFSSLVILREAIARRFTDDVTVAAPFKCWDFLFKDPATIVDWLLKSSSGKLSPRLRELLKTMPAEENDAWLKESISEANEITSALNGAKDVSVMKHEMLELLQFTVDNCVDCAYVLANRTTGSEDVINQHRFNKYFGSLLDLRKAVVRNYPNDADVLEELKRWKFLFKDSRKTVKWIRKVSAGKIPCRLRWHLKKIPASNVPCLLAPRIVRT